MNYIDINQIYKYYKKELSTWHLLNIKEKLLFIIPSILSIVFVYSIVYAAYSKIYKIYILSGIIYIITIILFILIFKKFFTRFKIENGYVDMVISPEVCIRNYRRIKLNSHLADKYKITTKEQKQLFIEMLKEYSNKRYDLKNLWVIGLFAALFIPVWEIYIQTKIQSHMESFTYYITFICTIAITIVAVIVIMKFSIDESIIYLLNRKSDAFKQIILIIQEDLMFNYYNKSGYSGELIIKRIG